MFVVAALALATTSNAHRSVDEKMVEWVVSLAELFPAVIVQVRDVAAKVLRSVHV